MKNFKPDDFEDFFYDPIESRFGTIGIFWKGKDGRTAVTRILLPAEAERISKTAGRRGFRPKGKPSPEMDRFFAEIRDYLEGKPVEFSFSLLDMSACPDFQKKVLRTDQKIPRGKVATYGGLAQRIGAPRGARPVGTAQALNPFPIVVPCHRVVRSDGGLGGYGGGLGLKRSLLEMEGVRFDARGRVKSEYIW